MSGKPEVMKRKIISLPDVLVKAIGDYRFEARCSTETEAIRQLIIAGLNAVGRPVEIVRKGA